MFLFLLVQGPKLGDQIKEGDPGGRPEGQRRLWGVHQGKDTVIILYLCSSASTSVFQDYETDLAAYTSGLETLLNIPIKRTMLKSPTVDLNQEVTH